MTMVFRGLTPKINQSSCSFTGPSIVTSIEQSFVQNDPLDVRESFALLTKNRVKFVWTSLSGLLLKNLEMYRR